MLFLVGAFIYLHEVIPIIYRYCVSEFCLYRLADFYHPFKLVYSLIAYDHIKYVF